MDFMELIDYTNKWVTGEINEGRAIMIAGIVALLVTVVLWRCCSQEIVRALLIPLLIVGLFHTGTGVGMIILNRQRVEQFAQQYQQQTPQEFAQAEQARVDGFMGLYPQTIIWSTVILVVAVCLFAFFQAHWARGTALVMIYLALSLLVIDYFSKYRADVYQQELKEFITENI